VHSTQRHPAAKSHYLKVRERTSYAFAVVSAAAALQIEGPTIVEARIALGGVALKPWRARAAEQIWPAHVRIKPPSAARPGRRSQTRSRPVTTPSRSSLRDES
jgi:CO/xanthine dehydrogenase FAD-binding subunit